MKYMLLMNYYVEGVPPIDKWAPQDVQRHIQFQHDLGAELVAAASSSTAKGSRGRTPPSSCAATGCPHPVVTDGPFPESKEFLAGYWMVDVEDEARAIEIAAKASAAPGPGGVPMQQVFEVRALMEAPAPVE